MTEKVKAVLYDDDVMQGLFKAGFITSKVFLHRDIFLWVSAQIKVRNIDRLQIIKEAAAKFDCSTRTISRAIDVFSE